ncbi:MAG: ABC transporter substrate-binding protein [Thermodesulfobacteriota bacterium]
MTRRRMFRQAVCAVLAAVAIMMSAVSGAQAASGDTIKVGIPYDLSTVNMLEIKLAGDIPVVLLMHQSLLIPHPITGDRIGVLAKSFEILEDGKKIKVEMYQGAKFHTGDPVTAHDVKFTYEEGANPSNANMLAGALDEIEDIEVKDDYTLIFHFWEAYAPWEELMWLGICSKKYYEKVGPEKFRSRPVGSGPLRFVERRIGEYVLLETVEGYPFYAPEGYPEESYSFKYLKIMTIPDDMTRLAMLETGELDLVGRIQPHQLKRLKRNKHVTIKKTDQVPSLVGIAFLPYTDPIMMDRNLCLAIRYGINRQEIVDKILLGEGYPLYMYASRAELGYDPNVVFEYDLEKARGYLKKSGYKKGTPLTFTYTSLVPNAPLIAALIQQYLQRVGITIKLQQLEEGTAVTYTRNRDKRLGHMRLYQWPGSRDPDLRLRLSSLSTSAFATVTNRPRREEYDKLILAQTREMDKAKRADLIRQIQDINSYDAIGAILYGQTMIYGMSDRIDYTWTPKEAYFPHLQRIKILK